MTGKSWIQVGDKQPTQSTIPMPQTEQANATINVSSGITLNLGNYESLRIDVGITLPCKPTKKEIEDTYSKCIEWVEEKLQQQTAEVKNSMRK